MTPHPLQPGAELDAEVNKRPISMKAGYAGGKCELCRKPIHIGDTYFFMRDERATVACAECALAAVASGRKEKI